MNKTPITDAAIFTVVDDAGGVMEVVRPSDMRFLEVEFNNLKDKLESVERIAYGEIDDEDETELIGLLVVKTDWDYGVVIGGVAYADNSNSIPIESLDQLKNITFLGPFGARVTENAKLWEIKSALESILANPEEPFGNTGGNRGAEWHPYPKNNS